MLVELLIPMIVASTIKVSGALVGFYQGLMILQSGESEYYIRIPPALTCNADLYSLPKGTQLTVIAEKMPSGVLVAREIYGDSVKCSVYQVGMGPRGQRRGMATGTPVRQAIIVPKPTAPAQALNPQAQVPNQAVPRGPVCVACHGEVPITTSMISSKVYSVDGYVVDRYPVNFTRLIVIISKEPIDGKYYVYHVVLPPYCNAPELGQEVKLQIEARREAEAENFHWVWGLALNC